MSKLHGLDIDHTFGVSLRRSGRCRRKDPPAAEPVIVGHLAKVGPATNPLKWAADAEEQ
jgi:hypothetical protein